MYSKKETNKLRLISKVARLYYEQDIPQKQIAEKLHLSQATISRLLKKGKQEKIIRTTVNVPIGVYSDLEDELQAKYRIQEVIIADCQQESEEEIIRSIGGAAAYYLETRINHHEIVGISSWSSTLLAMVEAMHPLTNVKNTKVVQILGGIGNPAAEIHATNLTKRLATLIQGEAVFLPSPAVVNSKENKKSLLQDTFVKLAIDLFDEVSLALVGIGALEPSLLLANSGNAFSSVELNDLEAQNAIGDICLRFFDANGHSVDSALDERVMSMSLDKIRKVPRVLGLAGGKRKIKAIKAALEGGLINILITDCITGKALLEKP